MRPTFESTIDILVKAYLNDELEHRTCTACVVGNLVAHALGTKPDRLMDDALTKHNMYYFANGTRMSWWTCRGYYGDEQAQLTGYTPVELWNIEQAFENAPGKPHSKDGRTSVEITMNPEWMFNGLMAVVDVLAEIHNVDLSVREETKLLFVKS